jgi:hypothetical protein
MLLESLPSRERGESRAAGRAAEAEPLVRIDNGLGRVQARSAVLLAAAGDLPRGATRRPHAEAGRDARGGGRVGLRQDHHRPRAGAPGARRARARSASRAARSPPSMARASPPIRCRRRWCSRIRSPRSIRA